MIEYRKQGNQIFPHGRYSTLCEKRGMTGFQLKIKLLNVLLNMNIIRSQSQRVLVPLYGEIRTKSLHYVHVRLCGC